VDVATVLTARDQDLSKLTGISKTKPTFFLTVPHKARAAMKKTISR
jgi:hypothetical protein